jgi:glutathione S-transferase
MRLYTFNISHFAEKARWALDRTGIRYEERVLLPGPHIPTVRRLRQGTTSVPALVDDGRAIQGSSRIIDYIDDRYLEPEHRLTPAEPELRAKTLELEGWLDAEIGETVRRIFYQHALPHRELVGMLFAQRGPWWAKTFYGLAYPKIARVIRRMYDINEMTAAADAERLRVALGKLDEMLARSPYLLGNCFTRADLTLAALTAPIWRPAEHSTPWPARALYPDSLRSWMDELSRFRVRDHALRVYREHRRATMSAALAAMKTHRDDAGARAWR